MRIVDKEWSRLQCQALLVISDLFVVSACFLCANLLYLRDVDSVHGLTMLGALGPIYIGIASFNRAYQARVLESATEAVTRSLQALAFAAASVLFIAYFLKAGSEFSRVVFALGLISSIILLPLSRLLLRRFLLKLLGGTPYTTVVIKDSVAYEGDPHDIVVTPGELGFEPTTADPMHFNALARTIAHADRVVVACPQERYVLWSSVLKGMAVHGEILTDEHDHLDILGLAQRGGRRTLIVAAGPLDLRQRVLKRGLDVVLSLGGLILTGPLLIATAIAIRLESKGAALFRQDRIGRDNRIFRIYKFRSMYVDRCDADAATLTSRDDDRVTKVGEFIRRTSIDELPQLINVLKGDMSMVGPRPHAISAKAADLLYWEVDPRYRHRHSMKPGLTGLAQVRGFRGTTDRTEDLTNRLLADLEYANNWSIWTDIKIIFRTIGVLTHQNAF
ncbi:MAG TPA: sugar transferase [Allosphingosinicella sp.]|nr:sugar transferase [Allosphingosinicella sp.]